MLLVRQSAGESRASPEIPRSDLRRDSASCLSNDTQRRVPVSYPKINPPILTRIPIIMDRTVRNLTGESSYAPASLSGSGPILGSAAPLPSGVLAFSACFDRWKRPILERNASVSSSRRIIANCNNADCHRTCPSIYAGQ